MKFNFLIITSFFLATACSNPKKNSSPNFLVIFTDDQRYDAVGFMGNDHIHTPHLDSMAATGLIFDNAFVTLSICSPSRAALLTGRYGNANGVTTFGDVALNRGESTFANYLRNLGYQTGIIGKWHLKNTPQDAGFDHASYFFSNGPWYDRKINENGNSRTATGYIEEYIADQSIDYLDSVSQNEAPFLLFHCTQVPHLDNNFEWDVQKSTLENYKYAEIPLPENWDDNLFGKPSYLKTGRHRQKAIEEYHYDEKDTVVNDLKRYYAAITEMDEQLGRIFRHLGKLGIDDNTYIIFMGDNGWFLGEHKFTSKVLAYEESIRVPFFIAGPGIAKGRSDEIVLNIDVLPTILDVLDQNVPEKVHGRSLLPLLRDRAVDWRDQFYYEAPEPQLGSWPHFALRTGQWKYIRTYDIDNRDSLAFEELYNLWEDPNEMNNLAGQSQQKEKVKNLAKELEKLKSEYQD